jgi:predicted Zn-dependent peptidase
LTRRIPDFHAVSVMSAILGGLFNSRLNMKLREEKGYSYGASAGFDLRRGAGPFAARAAVNTEVTVPAVLDMLGELDRMRSSEADASELTAARDFLIGVFPLRFETAGAVVGALSGLAVHELDLDELVTYRQRIEAVDSAAVASAAAAHLHLNDAAIVLVGDVDAFGEALEAENLGPMVIERDPIAEPQPGREPQEAPGPIDTEGQEGPTAGAEEPELSGGPGDDVTAD